MFIEYTVKKGEKFADICKKHGVSKSDQTTIWKMKQNSKIQSKRKSPDNLQAGDKVWMPDPGVTLNKITFKGATYYLTDKEFAAYQKKVQVNLAKTIVAPADLAYRNVYSQFKTLIEMPGNTALALATVIIQYVGWTKLDHGKQQAAHNALFALKNAVKKGDGKAIKAAMDVFGPAMDAFAKDVNTYTDRMLIGGKYAEWGATLTRDIGYKAAEALASRALKKCPGAIGDALEAGSVSTLFTMADEIGKALAGQKPMSMNIVWSSIRKGVADGVVAALNNGLGKKLSDLIGQRLALKMLKSKALVAIVGKIAKSPLGKKLIGDHLVDKIGPEMAKRVLVKRLADEIKSAGTGKFVPMLTQWCMDKFGLLTKAVVEAVKSGKGTEGPSQLADAAMAKLPVDRMFFEVVEQMLEERMSAIGKALEADAAQLQSAD
ncbi:MAG: LysM peptidoglycan-binding domain-containing protein [Pseudomonadota bacterium]